MSLSQLIPSPPAHRVRIKTEGMIPFSASLWNGRTIILSVCFFVSFIESLELMYRISQRDVLFLLLEYEMCGFVREVFRVRVRALSYQC